MTEANKQIIRTLIDADASVTPEERQAFDLALNGIEALPRIVSTADAAKTLGCSIRTIWNMIKFGKLHGIHRGTGGRYIGVTEASLKKAILGN